MSYQAAEALRQALSLKGVKETWIVSGGVDIQCYKHELKKVLKTLNSLAESVACVSINLTVFNKHRSSCEHLCLVRKQNQPTTVITNK